MDGDQDDHETLPGSTLSPSTPPWRRGRPEMQIPSGQHAGEHGNLYGAGTIKWKRASHDEMRQRDASFVDYAHLKTVESLERATLLAVLEGIE